MSHKVIMFVSMEAITAIFTLVVLAANLMQRRDFATRKPMTIVLIDQFLLLLCQIGEWLLAPIIESAQLPAPFITLAAALNVFDFFFYSMSAVFYFNYVSIVVASIDGNKAQNRRLLWTMYTAALLSSFGFLTSLWTGWFYVVLPNGVFEFTSYYWILVVANMLISFVNMLFILINSKMIGRRAAILYLTVPIVPAILVFVDQLYLYAFSYLALAIVNIIVFLGAELQRDMELVQKDADLKKSEAIAMETKAKLMLSQIQPHFIFNSLTTIANLCVENPIEAEAATLDFAGFLKGNLRTLNAEKPIPFKLEMEYLRHYLNLQSRRFGNMMKITYDIQTEDFVIPPLTVQPLVENAIHHAVEKRFDPTTILVRSEQTDSGVIVQVIDDGEGFDVNQKPKDDCPHIGIQSVRSRLKHLVGGTLEISSTIGKGTTATIILPKEDAYHEGTGGRQ